MKKMSLKMIAAMSVMSAAMGPAIAETYENAGALEFVTVRTALETLDFRAQSRALPELQSNSRKLIVLPAELPRFRPVSIFLNMGTGF